MGRLQAYVRMVQGDVSRLCGFNADFRKRKWACFASMCNQDML